MVKYGGHAMGEEDMAKSFARDIVLMEQTAINPVVVHGGGPQIGDMLKRLGIKSEFAAGLRVTDAATIEIVEMVLAGSINKQIVGFINGAGGRAVGLCGKDGNMVLARKISRTMVRSRFAHREDRRSRLRRRARQDRHHRAHADPGPRPHSGAGADRHLQGGGHLQHQCRYVRGRDRGRAQGQAAAAADRRAGRARQVEDPDPGALRRRRPPADRRRHRLGRHDPQGRDLSLRARGAASRASSSWTAGCRTRCCSSCSPITAPAR